MKALFLILTCIITPHLHAQELYPVLENGLYGYMDNTGKTVIPARFTSVQNFSEGLAPARERGLYGYIDISGNFVLPPIYEYATPFVNSIAVVHADGLPVFIDKKGGKAI